MESDLGSESGVHIQLAGVDNSFLVNSEEARETPRRNKEGLKEMLTPFRSGKVGKRVR